MQGGEPYAFEDPVHAGQLIGFEVDIAEAVARELGVRQQFVQSDWTNLIPALDRGSFDMAMNGLEVTPEHASRVLFTRPYYAFSLRLMARRDDPRIQGLASLAGLNVGTLANSLAWHVLLARGALARPYEGSVEPYDDLEQGRTDAVLLDDIIAQRYGMNHRGLRVVADVVDGYYAIGVGRADEDLRAALDTALNTIAGSGELRRILAKWQIDGDRQQRLVQWTDAETLQFNAHSVHPHFDGRHVVLFLEGARSPC